MANFMSLEMSEHRFPLRFDYFRIREDSGGAGWHRGGCGTEYGFTTLSDTTVSVLGDRVDHAPFGICGGGAAQSNSVTFVTGGKSWKPTLRSKQEKESLSAGDSLRVGSPGGGGWGNPLERPLSAVELDLNRGVISPETAQEKYGVVIGRQRVAYAGSPEFEIDISASESERSKRLVRLDKHNRR